MTLNLACRKFSRLVNEREDRDLSLSERAFFESHLDVCPRCSAIAGTNELVLSVLRDASLDPEPSAQFDERVLRRVQIQFHRDGFRYWSPALIGAGIACIAILSFVHLAASPNQIPSTNHPVGEARRLKSERNQPTLELDRVPTLTR